MLWKCKDCIEFTGTFSVEIATDGMFFRLLLLIIVIGGGINLGHEFFEVGISSDEWAVSHRDRKVRLLIFSNL